MRPTPLGGKRGCRCPSAGTPTRVPTSWPAKTVTAANFREGLRNDFGALPEPLLSNTDTQALSRAALERDLRFGYETWKWTQRHAASGASVYAYRFEHQPPYPADSPFARWGAGHGMEMRYVFDQLRLEPWVWSPADRHLAEAMAGYWTNFAKHGNPNGPGLPNWPAYTSTLPSAMHFGATLEARPRTDTGALPVLDPLFEAVRQQRSTPAADPRLRETRRSGRASTRPAPAIASDQWQRAQAKPCSRAWCKAAWALLNFDAKRITRSTLAIPRPDRMETRASKPPSSLAWDIGEIRNRPSSKFLFLSCI